MTSRRVGAYEVRQRTDGLWVLADDRLPPDGSVAWVCPTEEAAIREAERLTRLGSPVVVACDAPGLVRIPVTGSEHQSGTFRLEIRRRPGLVKA